MQDYQLIEKLAQADPKYTASTAKHIKENNHEH